MSQLNQLTDEQLRAIADSKGIDGRIKNRDKMIESINQELIKELSMKQAKSAVTQMPSAPDSPSRPQTDHESVPQQSAPVVGDIKSEYSGKMERTVEDIIWQREIKVRTPEQVAALKESINTLLRGSPITAKFFDGADGGPQGVQLEGGDKGPEYFTLMMPDRDLFRHVHGYRNARMDRPREKIGDPEDALANRDLQHKVSTQAEMLATQAKQIADMQALLSRLTSQPAA